MNKKKNIKALDVRIKQLVVELEKHEKDSEGYATILNNINKLSETRKVLAPDPNPQSKLNMNTVFSALVSLGGVILVTNYEKAEVITGKAFSMVQRLFK